MSESVKPRFAVDLSEIERQIAQAQGAVPAQPASTTRGDPLAELARIVGQDDPFQSLLTNDGSARQRQHGGSVDDLFAVRGDVTPAPQQAAYGRRGASPEPAFDLDQYPQVDPRGAQQAYAHQAQGQDVYGDDPYAQDYYDDNAAPDYGHGEHADYPPVEKRRSRKGLVAIGAVLGATVLGVGGLYVFGGNSPIAASGQPPLVQASTEPVKVQPQNPGGVEIPNQNKQIYERAAQTVETKVVNREEQPVDVKQAVRMNSGGVADATGATIPAAAQPQRQPPGGLDLGEPRKVRTVAIRPDGTSAQPEPANHRPAAVPVPAMTLPAAAQAQPVQVAAATPSAPAQPRAVASTPAASTPVAVPATPAAQKPAPAAATPTSGSSPQKVAAAQAAPAASASEAAATGGFAVQLGLANSETAAETALAQYQRKYPDLGGMPSLIRKAEVNGNTIYRVRVGPLSREEASSLCSKLQGQGGQCFVAKN